jgi:hypothetical protein
MNFHKEVRGLALHFGLTDLSPSFSRAWRRGSGRDLWAQCVVQRLANPYGNSTSDLRRCVSGDKRRSEDGGGAHGERSSYM